ncbi:hypothetical protein UY3_08410 [Chelonia mydas]|uniref:Uncharacterized protein n=1 Tax=Chelonia mydas TaxID=8469 RepID=M7BB89_CHEMY|nr:hypothetical protein UY3_08410 [Chelonia mydas]
MANHGHWELRAAAPVDAQTRRYKSTPEHSPIDSCTPPAQEVQAESTGERQQSTHRSEVTAGSHSRRSIVLESRTPPPLPLEQDPGSSTKISTKYQDLAPRDLSSDEGEEQYPCLFKHPFPPLQMRW